MGSDVELLVRWSHAVELATVMLLAGFFVALTRTIRLQEVRAWAAAWTADAGAIAVALLAPALAAPAAASLARASYAALKIGFVLLLAGGARNHLRPGAVPPLRLRWVAAAVVSWSVALGWLAPDRNVLQLGVALPAGVFLTSAAVWVLRRPRAPRSRWLGAALLSQGVVLLYDVPLRFPALDRAASLLHGGRDGSFPDAAAALFTALAILVVIEGSSSRHLEHLNQELVASQESLRQLVDLDPLTSLANRRRLRNETERLGTSGAAIVFLDIDNFKDINDRFGHIAGDACLLRVAAGLRHAFRANDALFRLGGDEFLVIAPGLDADAAAARVEALRAGLSAEAEGVPPCRISVGVARLAPRGEFDAALREADDRMYAEKRHRRSPNRPRRDAAMH